MSSLDRREEISTEFAKELLRALYRLDKPIDELDFICAELPDGDLKTKFVEALGEIMRQVLSDLIVPIYRQRPELGRASEPGPWLTDSESL